MVVGASLAGLRAAEAMRQAGFDGDITLVGREPHPPYNRPPLTKAALAEGPDLSGLTLPCAPDLDARWMLGVSATGLDLGNRDVLLATGEALPYDGLVVATGAHARRLDTPAAPTVHHVRTFDDAVRLHRALARPSQRVLVVGAGLLGSEIASTALGLGHRVTLVEASEGPMLGAFGPQLSAYCADLHREQGVDLRTSTALLSLSPVSDRDRAAVAVLADASTGERRTVRADVVVAALGATPATAWLRDTDLDADRGVRTDDSLTALDRAGRPVQGVVAVGDVATVPQPLLGGAECRVEHWVTAAGHARVAAATLLGLQPPTPPTLPAFSTHQHGHQIRALGLPGAGDTTTVVAGSPADHHFVAVRTLGDRVVGVVAVNDAPGLLRRRSLLEAEPTRPSPRDHLETSDD